MPIHTTTFTTPNLHGDFNNIDVQYRLYNGILQIVGSYERVLDSANAVLFTLPNRYFPEVETRIHAYNDNNFMRAWIQTDGDVVVMNSTSAHGIHHISCYIPIANQ